MVTDIVATPLDQCARAVCLCRPAAFGFNPQTAGTNHLQQAGAGVDDAGAAIAEFDTLVARLRASGVRVGVLEDRPEPVRPDAVFPNNWVSFHRDGTCVLYPMQSENRRLERRPQDILAVARELGFIRQRTLDFTVSEAEGRFLEGTGSLVLDHVQRIAYLARSPRSDESVAEEWCAQLGYSLEAFDASTTEGDSIYHTNVLLWIGARVAAVGLDWIAPPDRARVRDRLRASGRTLVELGTPQLSAFAGNMLEVQAQDGGTRLVMSRTAANSLTAEQRQRIYANTDEVIVMDVPVIELRGGGSVRCMLAEVP
ncbi:MAG: citrulline utilization hydrolase CtlX [Steroidobacteraceae bacterium]